MKITDSPAAMLVMPFSKTEVLKELESSSIFQPVILTAERLTLVTSNQSAPKVVLLLHGATSVMTRLGVGTVKSKYFNPFWTASPKSF